MYIFMHVNVYMCGDDNKKKEAINLKENEGVVIGGVE